MSFISDVRLEISGSMLSGFMLKSSDINLDIFIPNGAHPSTASALLATRKIVENNNEFE